MPASGTPAHRSDISPPHHRARYPAHCPLPLSTGIWYTRASSRHLHAVPPCQIPCALPLAAVHRHLARPRRYSQYSTATPRSRCHHQLPASSHLTISPCCTMLASGTPAHRPDISPLHHRVRYPAHCPLQLSTGIWHAPPLLTALHRHAPFQMPPSTPCIVPPNHFTLLNHAGIWHTRASSRHLHVAPPCQIPCALPLAAVHRHLAHPSIVQTSPRCTTVPDTLQM